MRKVNLIFLFINIICVNFSEAAPRVIFGSTVYKVNESVTGTLTQKVTGISNEIINGSQVPQNLAYDLGVATKAGIYRVDFYFSPIDVESYFIYIYPSSVSSADLNSIVPAKTIKTNFSKFIEAIIKYNKDKNSFVPIITKSIKEYSTTHAIDLTVGFAACIAVPISASGGLLLSPIFAAQCRSSSFDATKDLLIQFMGDLKETLFTKKYLTANEYQIFKAEIKALDVVTNFTLGNTLEKVLAVASLTEIDTEQKIVMGADFGDQLYKKYQFILKLN